MALRDIRELKNDPEAYAAELEQRWTGLLSYRYIGRNHGSMNTGEIDNTVTLRHDMRNATGGLLVAPIAISSPEGDVGSDLVTVPNPVIHSCQIIDPGQRRHAHRGHRVGGAARSARMGYSRSKIVDADDHTRVIAFTEGQGAKIGEVPEGLEKMPEDKLEIVDSPDLPPLWQVFGASAATTATGRSPSSRSSCVARRRAPHRSTARRPGDRRDRRRRRARRHRPAADAVVARDVPRPGQGRTVPGRQRSGPRAGRSGRCPHGAPRRGQPGPRGDLGDGAVRGGRVAGYVS